MIVYYQNKYIDPNTGSTIYMGEDTYPYATPELLIVADGLGGRGSWRHTTINPDVLDQDKFYDLVFAPILTKDPSPKFKEYVMTCFQEVFLTKDYYFDIPNAVKTSAYFASRLTSCIVAYELEYDVDNFDRKKIFDAADRKDSDAIQAYADKLAELIKEKLEIVAENLNLSVDSNILGTNRPYLLPSTLQVAMLREKKDSVQAVYFWAGDSRAYAWEEKDGLAVLNEDHEIAEVMTNLVSLSEPFRLETRLFEIKKPCVLFNTSDGFYKGRNMNSFGLENTFLEAFIAGADYEEAALYWASFFDNQTKHDDSNTMALWAFGYKDFAELKQAARDRMETFRAAVIDPLPDIFSNDYPHLQQNYEDEVGDAIFSVGRSWLKLPCALNIAKRMLMESGYKPYLDGVASRMEAEKGAHEEKKAAAIQQIREKYEALFPEELPEEEDKAPVAAFPAVALRELKGSRMLQLRYLAMNYDVLFSQINYYLASKGLIREPVSAPHSAEYFASMDEKALIDAINDMDDRIQDGIDRLATLREAQPATHSTRQRQRILRSEFDVLERVKDSISELEEYGDLAKGIPEIDELLQKAAERKAQELARERARKRESIKNLRKSLENDMQQEISETEARYAEGPEIDEEVIKEEVAAQLAPRFCNYKPRDILNEIWAGRDAYLTAADLLAAETAIESVNQRYAEEKEHLDAYVEIEKNYQKTYKRYFKKSVFLAEKKG